MTYQVYRYYIKGIGNEQEKIMPRTAVKPVDIQELIQNCQAIIASNGNEEQFEQIAKTVTLTMAEALESPTTLRRKLGELRQQLNKAFKENKKYTKTTKKNTKDKGEIEVKNFILSELIFKIERAIGIQDGDAVKTDYPRILENIRIYNGLKDGEIVLRENLVNEEVVTDGKPDEVEEIVSIDVEEYLQIASNLLKSDEWTDIAIGVAMTTLRREVEVCAAMEFQAKDEYTLIVSSPVKKRTTDKYYEIPCLLPSDDIEEAIDRMRSMTNFERFDIQKQLGNKKQANKEFNNCYKQPLIERYSSFIREKLNTKASVDERDYFHQLRSIGAAIYKSAKKQSYKRYSSKYENQCIKFVSGVLVHESSGATIKYGGWDVTNIPQYVIDQCNRNYGNVVKKLEKSLVLAQFDIASLQKGLAANEKALQLFSEICNPERLQDPKALGNALIAVFTQAVKEPSAKNQLLNAVSTREVRGVIARERVGLIIEAMLKHNADSEYKVFICESQVRAAYKHIYGELVGFDLVRKMFEEMGSTIPDHNQYKGLDKSTNLRLRGSKIKLVYDELKN